MCIHLAVSDFEIIFQNHQNDSAQCTRLSITFNQLIPQSINQLRVQTVLNLVVIDWNHLLKKRIAVIFCCVRSYFKIFFVDFHFLPVSRAYLKKVI